jgi:hypothetical protein
MSGVRVTRLLINNYRGWDRLDLRLRGHVLLAGVPRSGRSDIIAALRRVLDPASSQARPFDIHQRSTAAETIQSEGSPATPGEEAPVRPQFAEVEVTLTDLDPEVQQLFDGYLEPLDPDGCASDDIDADPSADQCVRLTYRLTYDADADLLEAFIYYPVRSDPAMSQYSRVPAATRRALPILGLNSAQPLQLRAGAALRRILDAREPDAANVAFTALSDAVGSAVAGLSADAAVAGAVDQVLQTAGTGMRLGDTAVTAEDVGFVPDDGTVAALLRTLQPALRLDQAGPLALSRHGSTAMAVLSAAEAMLLANLPGAVVLADDFGDQLDAAAAEHLAALLRARSGQLWLSTRRPEAARAFEPTELVRLTRHGGVRAHHQLDKITDRKALPAMRQLHTQLLAAMSARTVAITEGPHDVAVYSMVDRRYPPNLLPLSTFGVRLVAAGTGQDGGIDQIPRVAALARALGFRVIAVIDRDKDSAQAETQVSRIEAACDVVIRLPAGAIERAMLAGIRLDAIVVASATLTEYGIPDPAVGRTGDAALTELCKVVHKQGLHEQLLEALYTETATHPPLIQTVLSTIVTLAATPLSGNKRIDLDDVPRPVAAPK